MKNSADSALLRVSFVPFMPFPLSRCPFGARRKVSERSTSSTCELLMVSSRWSPHVDALLTRYSRRCYFFSICFRQLSELRDSHRDLEMEFGKVVAERDQLYDTFEGAVRAVQQKSDFRCDKTQRNVKAEASASRYSSIEYILFRSTHSCLKTAHPHK